MDVDGRVHRFYLMDADNKSIISQLNFNSLFGITNGVNQSVFYIEYNKNGVLHSEYYKIQDITKEHIILDKPITLAGSTVILNIGFAPIMDDYATAGDDSKQSLYYKGGWTVGEDNTIDYSGGDQTFDAFNPYLLTGKDQIVIIGNSASH
jgi:hypothetical protein